MIDHPVRDRIPIFVAGTGPRNVENAARIAAGWIPIFLWPERAAQVWNAALAAGLAQRDPALAPLEVSASVTVFIQLLAGAGAVSIPAGAPTGGCQHGQ
jgi:alkanesulfonate monooxygenase SsuD/methylene tetrahydromethanopterin reductase-like flavin-dependent oxidoreductase (luciferase family)